MGAGRIGRHLLWVANRSSFWNRQISTHETMRRVGVVVSAFVYRSEDPGSNPAGYYFLIRSFLEQEFSLTFAQVNSAFHPSGVDESSTSFGWG